MTDAAHLGAASRGALLALLLLSTASGAAGERPDLQLRHGRPALAPIAGVSPAARGAWREGIVLRGMEPDTARLAVILVEFPADDDPTTTGDGRFQRKFDDSYETNRPPHDRAYFILQCEAVANYFAAATSNRLRIEWSVFPTPPGTTFEMPNEMRYYNPDTTDAALDVRLGEFFRDAVNVADQGGVPFSVHDYTVVFHAGVGQDLLIAENTPSDIPSAFISLDELRDALGESPEWEGLPVEGGTHVVSDGLWLPETENQEGIEFGLTGVFAQLLGSQFGLPILFNPDSGAPGIGRFGLMDQGGGNLLGNVPAMPSAWERFDRGWADAIVVTNGTDLRVLARGGAARVGSTTDLVLVPVDDREYFLIENRKKELDGNGRVSLRYADESGSNVPVSVEAGEYDHGIPGSGVLIWHIDQAIIDENRADNRVNANFMHRGVKLLEADGLDDIGLRPQGGFGLPEDCFYAGNNTELTPNSNPSSRSNYGNADTHVFVTSISDTGAVMTLDVANDVVLAGWPDSTGTGPYGQVPAAAGDVDRDGDVEVLVADGPDVRIYGSDGTLETILSGVPRGSAPDITQLVVPEVGSRVVAGNADGAVDIYEGDALQATRRIAPLGPGAGKGMHVSVAEFQNFSGEGTLPGLLVAARADTVFFGPTAIPGFGATLPFTDAIAYALAPSNTMPTVQLIVISESGHLAGYVVTVVPDILVAELVSGYPPKHPPVLGDLDGDGTVELLYVTTGEEIVAFRAEPVTAGRGEDPGPHRFVTATGWPITPGGPLGPLSLGDVDGDGRVDVLTGGRNRLMVFGGNGIRLEGWPVTLTAFGNAGEVETEPLVADIDGDGGMDVVLASPDGLLRAWNRRGRPLAGWPIPMGRTHRVAPVVAAIGSGALLTVIDGTSVVSAIALEDLGTIHWGQQGGTTGRSGYLDPARTGPPDDDLPFLPVADLYVYPNPAHERTIIRYLLGESAEIEVRIYDVSGQEITRLHAMGVGGVTNEIEWNLENADREPVAPGLYVARLTAHGSTRTASIETKLAVFR